MIFYVNELGSCSDGHEQSHSEHNGEWLWSTTSDDGYQDMTRFENHYSSWLGNYGQSHRDE